MVAITVSRVNHEGYSADYTVSDLLTTKAYDVVRIIESDGTNNNERKYQVIAHRRDWVPSATSGVIRDYEAPLRSYSVAIYDSSLQTPLDWAFENGEYTGPAPLAQTGVINIEPPECGGLIRSTAIPGLWAEVKVQSTNISYPVRYSQHQIIGRRFPVHIMDRREGRTISDLVVWTESLTHSKALTDLLIPETGRVWPCVLRSTDEDQLLFHDLVFMPLDIETEPVSFAQPFSKWFHIEAVEVSTRVPVPERPGDGSLSIPPDAIIGKAPGVTGKKPFTVTFTDLSTGTISKRSWVIYDSRKTYTTRTSASFAYTFTRRGKYKVKLSISGPSGNDTSYVTITVT